MPFHQLKDGYSRIMTPHLERVSGMLWCFGKRITRALIPHEDASLISVAFCFAFGIAFFLSVEMDIPGAVAAVGCAIIISIGYQFGLYSAGNGLIRQVYAGLTVFLCGFTLTAMYAALLTKPIAEAGYYDVEGIIAQLDAPQPSRKRLLLCKALLVGQSEADRDHRDHTGACVRVTVRTHIEPGIGIGDWVTLRANLSPPPGPISPNGFDYARRAFFKGEVAVGYAVTDVALLDDRKPDRSIETRIDAYRSMLAQRMAQNLTGDKLALAVALSTGKREGLSETAQQNMRDAGLAHLLAISGLHMGLIVGFAFFLLERLFAVWPADRSPLIPTKLAAIGAFCVALSYLLLSGMAVSTVRAFIMVSVGLLAILTDRRAISLRSVALAALMIMIFEPGSAVSAGFHLSFAATAALVRFFEYWTARQRKKNLPPAKGLAAGVSRFFAVTMAATLVSQLAIAPFALFHFGAVSFIGSLANLVAMPLMSFWIMPIILLGLILAAVDSFAVVAPFLGYGLGQLLEIAKWFSELPYASLTLPLVPDVVLAITLVGFWCWLALEGRVSSIGVLLVFGVSSFLYVTAPTPDLLISGQGPSIGLKTEQGRFLTYKLSTNSYRAGSWMRLVGQSREAQSRVQGVNDVIKRQCDPKGCAFYWVSEEGRILLFSIAERFDAVSEDCGVSPLILSKTTNAPPADCKAIVIDYQDFLQKGPIAVYFDRDKGSVLSASEPPLSIKASSEASSLKTVTVKSIAWSLPSSKRRLWHQSDD